MTKKVKVIPSVVFDKDTEGYILVDGKLLVPNSYVWHHSIKNEKFTVEIAIGSNQSYVSSGNSVSFDVLVDKGHKIASEGHQYPYYKGLIMVIFDDEGRLVKPAGGWTIGINAKSDKEYPWLSKLLENKMDQLYAEQHSVS